MAFRYRTYDGFITYFYLLMSNVQLLLLAV
jgi:hypothetical protein